MILLVSGFAVVSPIQARAVLPGACNCVIFRLDDIQDYWLNAVQTTVLDQFINRNANVTLGVVMNFVGNDPSVVNKVKQGHSSNLFELDLHGWNHVDYTQLSFQDQKSTLQMANQKMQDLWGRKSNTFIPPYNAYDMNTINATSQLGLKILSSEFDLEIVPTSQIYKAAAGSNITDSFGVYHLPQEIGYYTYENGQQIKNSIPDIMSRVSSRIDSYGYAVVTLHPQDFAVKDPSGKATNVVNQTEISDLNTLITSVRSSGYKITTFSSVAKISLPPLIDNVPPTVTAPQDIALVTNDNPAAVTIGMATASDNIDPHPVIANNATSSSSSSNLFPRGTTAILWSATDANHNVGTAVQYVTVSTTNDAIKPAVKTASPSAGAAISGPAAGVNILVTGTASDGQSGVKLVDVRTSTAAYQKATPTHGGNNWSDWNYILNIKSSGSTTVVSRATDFFGNQQWDSTPITVSLAGPDTTPPFISAPPSMTVEATDQFTPVSLGKPFVFDNSDLSPKVTNNSPGASEITGFPLGTTVVTWTATDASGNSASSNQIINVVDTTPPPTPQPLSPANGAAITGNNSTISFGWSNVTDIVSSTVTYDMLVSPAADFSSPVITQTGLTQSSYNVPSNSLSTGTYYWKVRSSDASNNKSPYSSIQAFNLNTSGATVFASPPGRLYNSTQSVALAASQSGFTIYYTTDGSTPNTGSTIYSGPIPVSSSITLKFFGRNDDVGSTTPIVTETYTIDTIPPTVTASPHGGLYNTVQSVTLAASESATIYYTTDGSTPNTGSSVYGSSPIAIASNTDLKFFGRDTAGNNGQVVVETYVIDTVPPSVAASPPGGTYNATQSVILTASKPGSTIYYTIDGSTPTTSSPVYTAPISTFGPGTTTILKFFAVDGLGNTGVVVTATYTISGISFPVTQMSDTTASSGLATYSSQQSHVEFATPTSQLVGKSIDQMTIKLRKTGSPTGTAQIGVFNTDLTVKKLFGTKDTSTLTSTYTDYTFALASNELYTIQASDRIGIKYAGGDSNNFVAVMRDATNQFDGANSYRQQYGTASWTSYTSDDMYMILKQTHDATDTIPPTVTATPAGGTFTTVISVTLAANEPAIIYYTIDGSTPTTSSSIYSTPIQIASTATLKFFGRDTAGNASPVSTESYIINLPSFPITQMSDTTASSGLAMYSAQQSHVELVSSTSQLLGKSIDQITLKLRKTASPTGAMQIGIFNSDLTVKKLFGTKDASTLASTYADYTFALANNELYTLQSGDRIGIQFSNGDSANFVAVMLDRDAADPFDGTNTYRQQFTTSWSSFVNEDMYMMLKQTHG
jgi:peptidoglycan/xylan/chitin deacetylase (PgdA/CDA1 family)